MLHYIQSLPEAKLWAKFPQWFQALKKGDGQSTLDLLQSFSAEDTASMLSIMRAIAKLGRQAQTWLVNDQRYAHPGLGASDMLKICRFVCYEESDITNQWQDLEYALPKGPLVLKLLHIRKPHWFTKVYYHYLQDTRDFDYATGIALERIGSPVLSPSQIAQSLGDFLAETRRKKTLSTQELDAEYPEILNRDIWTLFTEKATTLGGDPPVTADYAQRYRLVWDEWYKKTQNRSEARDKTIAELGPRQYEPFNHVATVIVDGIKAGKLDRTRVLRECLLGICRNLEKEQPSGFADFFTALKPTPQELLDVQDELMAVLACPHSKAITAILKHIKAIIKHKDFDQQAFVQALPVLLCTKVKNVYTAALSRAEELAKHMPTTRGTLCNAIPSIFSAPDEAIQIRTAKFLNTYGDATDPNLRTEVSQWRPHLTVGAIALLEDFLDAEEHTQGAIQGVEQSAQQNAGTAATQGKLTHLDESLRIHLPQNLEECLFLLTEAFGNPAEYHYSLVPDALWAVRDELDDASLHRLGPAITAARKVVCSTDNTQKVHARTPALHFLRYCIARLETAQAKNVAALKKKLPDIIIEASSQYTVYNWNKYHKKYYPVVIPSLQNIFHPLDEVVEAAFARLRTGDSLPMLSSVTHAPCWIDPLELIARLLLWQQAGREPHTMDMQLALQRCTWENSATALTAAQALEGEYKDLLTYFLGDTPALPPKSKRKAWWITAALMRPERRVPPELLTPDFTDIPPEYFGKPFQWELMPMTKKIMDWMSCFSLMSIYTPGINPEKEFTTTPEQWLTIPLPRKKYTPENVHYTEQPEELPPHGKWNEIFCGRMFLAQDVLLLNQALALYPNNPEPLIMDFIAAYRREKSDKTLRFLEKLLELRVPMGPASHLLLALSFLAGAKELRLYAAAFWRTKVEEGHIDCAELGRLLGQLEAHKWAPIKRFTDIVDKELLAVSPLHSAQLATMLEAMLLAIGPEPPVAIKRILELYYELTAAQGKKIPAPMLPLLDAWASEKTQAAIIKNLRKLE